MENPEQDSDSFKNQEEDPAFRLLLQELRKVDVPDYPDYRRGLRWGTLLGGIVTLTTGAGAWLFQSKNFGIGSVLIVGVIFFLVAWAFGAFRPHDL